MDERGNKGKLTTTNKGTKKENKEEIEKEILKLQDNS